jgi:uncharacterized protein
VHGTSLGSTFCADEEPEAAVVLNRTNFVDCGISVLYCESCNSTGTRQRPKANLAKHGVSFETAKLVFQDRFAIVEPDEEPSEERWRLIGMVRNALLFVVFTEQAAADPTVVRLISARQATKAERRRNEEEES